MIKELFNKIFKSATAPDRKEGKVKFFNNSKGFGFIIVKDSEEEIFVHTTNTFDKIRENDQVTFEIEIGEKGPSAVNVRKAS